MKGKITTFFSLRAVPNLIVMMENGSNEMQKKKKIERRFAIWMDPLKNNEQQTHWLSCITSLPSKSLFECSNYIEIN